MAKEKKTKKDALKDITSGIEPIVGDTPTVEIEGRTYQLRRLGIQDTFKVIRIISIGITQMVGVVNFNQLTPETAVLAIIAAVPYAEQDIFELLASLIEVDVDELKDPELFPIGSEVAIINALAEHQDLQAFFTQLQRLADTNPAVQQAIQQTQNTP